jgi:hypothetical protein
MAEMSYFILDLDIIASLASRRQGHNLCKVITKDIRKDVRIYQ